MLRWLLLPILILFATVVASAQSDVKVSSELDEAETIVGQPVTLRVKILVPTWMTKGAEFPNLEVPGVMVRLPQRSGGPVSETIDGETWSGVTRGYQIFPLQVGTFEVPGQNLRITYADPDTNAPVEAEIQFDGARFRSILPEGAIDLNPPIVANSFSLEQTVEGEAELDAGGAITRTLTAKIDGTTPVLIPELTPKSGNELLKAYTDEPVVNENENRGVLSGSRTEKTTYIGQSAGTTTIPAVTFSWFNLERNEIETVTIPQIDVTVAEGAGVSSQGVDIRQLGIWGIWLLAGAILIAVLYRYLYPPILAYLEEKRRERLASEEHAHHQVLQAIKSKDLNSVSQAVENWLAFYPGVNDRLQSDIAASLSKLGAIEFGTEPAAIKSADWDTFQKDYRRLRKRELEEKSHAVERSVLPALNPGWNPRH
ncbi:MAG: hypothetical protein AAF362_08095 [Pseudomonadota bacterium]